MVFRLANLDTLGILDLLLVSIIFYLLLNLVRRSQAAFLLRGALALGVILLVVTILLPLPTFDWLVNGVLLAMLVAAPVILQPELRRLLERVGRYTGLSRAVRQTTAETVIPRLLRTVETLSSSQTGALIVLGGDVSLQPYIDTGIRIDSRVTGELLETIFFDKTPLHDGAIILQEDRIVAASCVLPLSQQQISSYRRLGTRHRAAVGMSEVSDALVIVVSEETGAVSVAHRGKLHQRLDSTALRQRVFDFYTEERETQTASILNQLLERARDIWRDRFLQLTWREVAANVGLFLAAFVVTLVVWLFVLEQTNPTARQEISNIPLRVEDVPPGMMLMNEPPDTVTAEVRTTEALRPTLSTNNFQARASLAGASQEVNEIEVMVSTNVSLVEVISKTPSTLNLELAPIITRPVSVTVNIMGRDNVSAAYEVASRPVIVPRAVEVEGPAPLVGQVDQVQATLSVANANTTIQEVRPLRPLDENGDEVTGVTLTPDEAEITLGVSRRRDARDVGVRPITEGTPPEDYWFSGAIATPATVTLRGEPAVLDDLNGFVDTLPVDISEARGPVRTQVPLDLPEGVTAFDSSGSPVQVVTVDATVSPLTGDLPLTRTVEILGAREGITATISPPQVEMLLSGPLPVLKEIEADPDLVKLRVDVSRQAPITGQGIELVPEIIAPEEITVQLIPDTVLVTFER